MRRDYMVGLADGKRNETAALDRWGAAGWKVVADLSGWRVFVLQRPRCDAQDAHDLKDQRLTDVQE